MAGSKMATEKSSRKDEKRKEKLIEEEEDEDTSMTIEAEVKTLKSTITGDNGCRHHWD